MLKISLEPEKIFSINLVTLNSIAVKAQDLSFWSRLVSEVLSDMKGLKLAYHNDTHCVQVCNLSLELLDSMQTNLQLSQNFFIQQFDKVNSEIDRDKSMQSIIFLAALFHDYFHSGVQYRQLTNPKDYSEYSNEEYSNYKMRLKLENIITPDALREIESLILATSFGQKFVSHLAEGIQARIYRDYEPQSSAARLLCFADIAQSCLSLEYFYHQSTLAMEESGHASTSNKDYLIGRLKFVEFAFSRLFPLKSCISEELFNFYDDNLKEIKQDIEVKLSLD
jgi:hypothetical protein